MPNKPRLPLLALFLIAAGASLALAAPETAPTPIPVNPGVTTQPDESATTRPLLFVTDAQVPSDILLKDTLATLAANHEKLKLLHVVATNVTEMIDEKTHKWTLWFSSDGEAWVEAGPDHRARYDMKLQRDHWDGGLAPTVDTSYLSSWDGHEFRRWEHRDHPVTADERAPAEIADHSLIRNEWEVTGMSILNMMRARETDANNQIAFDGYEFDPQLLANAALVARRVTLNAHQPAVELHILRFDARAGIRDKTYYLDPAHNDALLGFTWREDFSLQLVVHQLTEAAPGLYLPLSATRLCTWPLPGERVSFRATKIVANETAPPNLFTLEFPAGAPVYTHPPAPHKTLR
jgi:hypothetical protein